jgi:15-cis-phytoene synthase/lycopene beta-cyclase
LVDNAESKEIARAWISKLSTFLNRIYSSPCYKGFQKQALPSNIASIVRDFPPSCQSALLLLPTSLISPKPIFDLLRGFETDLGFPDTDLGQLGKSEIFPIKDECDLELYASRVAGTVAELCIELVFYHSSTRSTISQKELEFIVNAGGRMGIALQYVNIARDIATDAAIQRVYLPTSWLEEEGLSPQDIISNPKGETVEIFRRRILGKAFNIYAEAKGALAKLPPEARAPMRVAVESYMEIGRVLREKGYKMKAGKATVPKTRRIRVAWKALNEG